MTSSYDEWAEIYDSVYSYVTEDIPFYVEESRKAGGAVLELGCGTGRVTIPIAEAGVKVVGLDNSPAMLDVARRKSARLTSGGGSPELVLADMREFSSALTERFRLVIIPFRGFLALLSVDEQIRTLEEIRRHLAEGGMLIFNVFAPDVNMLVQEGDVPYHFRDVTDPNTGARLVLWHQSRYDNHDQIINVRTIVEKLDGHGAVERKLYRDFQLRYVHRWEMHHLLKMCGFEVVDLYGDFNRSPFDAASTEMIWVARLPG